MRTVSPACCVKQLNVVTFHYSVVQTATSALPLVEFKYKGSELALEIEAKNFGVQVSPLERKPIELLH